MCSIATRPLGSKAVELAELVAQVERVHARIAAVLSDSDRAAELATVPVDALAAQVTSLLSAADRASAAATVLLGRVEAAAGPGSLIGVRYASPRRFLEAEARLSKQSAASMVARARDLREDFAVVEERWLDGRISSDVCREVTVGVRSALRHAGLPASELDVARKAALDIVLPVAERGTVEDVRRVLGHLALATNEDGATQAQMDAYVDQSLTVVQVGAMAKLTAYLTTEAAAAITTVLENQVVAMRRSGEIPEEQPPVGVDPATAEGRRRTRARHSHLLALALGETMTRLLDDDQVGSHHGIAPHVTLTVDLDRFAARLGGELALPGSDDDVLLPDETIRRILCDCDLTTVITRTSAAGFDSTGGRSEETTLAGVLLDASREVLYVGRTRRVVPPRLRRALEVRDRSCRFPGCRAHVRRCHAHHVREWSDGGGTDLDNTVLLCLRHHHAVHEGGWTISRAPDLPAGANGCWDFVPPDRPRRPR